MTDSGSSAFSPVILVGAVIWTVVFIVDLWSPHLLDLLHAVLMSVFLVWAPLTFDLLARAGCWSSQLARSAIWIGLCQVTTTWIERPSYAIWVTIPWLALMSTAVAASLQRQRPLATATAIFGLVGAMWWTGSQLAVPIFGFPLTMVKLTAVHFHVAGFITMALMITTKRFPTSAIWTYVITVGAMAAAISLHTKLEPFPAVVLAFLLAWFGIAQARMFKGRSSMVWVSSGCLWLALVIAMGYAYGQWSPDSSISWLTVARSHGLLQVFGFCGFGLGIRLIGR